MAACVSRLGRLSFAHVHGQAKGQKARETAPPARVHSWFMSPRDLAAPISLPRLSCCSSERS
jgi:hypothetical protein